MSIPTHPAVTKVDEDAESGSYEQPRRILWYRSTYYNALILGLCNFFAPGLWGAMNSLGAGGAQSPYLVNTANALIFCLMVVTAFLSSTLVKAVGIKITLILGTIGYAPYAAGLYTNNRYGTEWFVLFGAALCGLAAGTFWMAEGAIALSYPEPERQGKFLGFWLTFRIGGQIVGGAINLGINANRNTAGSVSYTVYLIFIALQCLAPFCGLLLTSPEKVQRRDGKKVDMRPKHSYGTELKLVVKLFLKPKFLLIIPLIANFVYTESVAFTYLSLWFSVRARSLGSFVSGIAAAIAGNLMGRLLDSARIKLHVRARIAFGIVVILQGAVLAWNIGNSATFRNTLPTYDWVDSGFGNAFAVFVLHVTSFQLSYMTLFWFCGEIAETNEEAVRIAGLLRATESASQAVSYGLSSIPSFAHLWGAVLNLGIWGVAVIPGWIIISQIGGKYGKHLRHSEAEALETRSIDRDSETDRDRKEVPN
ncbi:MFS general substrate transporter [Cylindrobasidium torrendii FP15055 ss-10]|uniref:MFS general substrate transporter n=1 Tax=Cylindrobasidium torrendii FP15055 ss-10 TaxID=1314674 RepID=A0A0D7BSS5_9AGAR|nr:MFS general substrate transporter [Cylindrobasidium torrendii FP15055 ss-10]